MRSDYWASSAVPKLRMDVQIRLHGYLVPSQTILRLAVLSHASICLPYATLDYLNIQHGGVRALSSVPFLL